MARRKRTTIEKEQDRAARLIAAADRDIDAFVARLERFLDHSLEQILGDLELDGLSAVEAAKQLGGLQSAMRELGLKGELGQIRGVFGRELDRVADEFERLGGKDFTLTSFDKANIKALVDTRIDAAAANVNRYLGDVRSIILSGAILGDVPKLSEVHGQASGRLTSSLTTELRTSTSAYSRIITQVKAEDAGLDEFLYVGPLDKVTRPFCRVRVGKVFTKKEIEKWDRDPLRKGQPEPASIYLGGYNCRHQLRPVGKEYQKLIEEDNALFDEIIEREEAKAAARRKK